MSCYRLGICYLLFNLLAHINLFLPFNDRNIHCKFQIPLLDASRTSLHCGIRQRKINDISILKLLNQNRLGNELRRSNIKSVSKIEFL